MSKTSAAAARALTSDFFELFGLARRYALDAGRLEQAYRDIQAKVHPDRFAHAGDAERRASMQMSTTVNDAYRTLKNPVARAKYLLELNGVDVAFETDTAMPTEFLMQQMELREQLEEAKDSAALDVLNQKLAEDKKEIEQKLSDDFDVKKDLESSKALVRKLMFFERLSEEVNEAYENV
jgi:molecular chaperone HscB